MEEVRGRVSRRTLSLEANSVLAWQYCREREGGGRARREGMRSIRQVREMAFDTEKEPGTF